MPKSVEFPTVPLPLSGAFKVLKRELRKPYWEKSDHQGDVAPTGAAGDGTR